jgi:hypothetical protein
VCHSKVEELRLDDDELVDVLVSEPMGTLLVNERMLETYLYARDHFLKPGGKLFPVSTTSPWKPVVACHRALSYQTTAWLSVLGYSLRAWRPRQDLVSACYGQVSHKQVHTTKLGLSLCTVAVVTMCCVLCAVCCSTLVVSMWLPSAMRSCTMS